MRARAAATAAAPFVVAVALRVLANDTAASVAAGGVVPRKEPRVSMLKERLAIRMFRDAGGELGVRVDVDYVFRNEGSAPVTTEVAFPAPPRKLDTLLDPPKALLDFKAWQGKRPVPLTRQIHALVHGRDEAALLRGLGIDIENFGNHNDPDADQIGRLLPADGARLVQAGLLADNGWPVWTSETTWHWTQVFPPGKVVHLRHEYTPWPGGEGAEWVPIESFLQRYTTKSCLDVQGAAALRRVSAASEEEKRLRGYRGRRIPHAMWVDYILTTANSWKTPIRDFELTVEAPRDWVGAFCWDGPVERLPDGRQVAHVADFVPAKELRVYFFGLL